MTADDVHAPLETHRSARGIAHWNKRYPDSPMRAVGVGLTKLRKLAKQIGRDHALSAELWQSDLYEARVIALLIDDPKQITRAQAEAQVERLDGGQLVHVCSSCDASLAKVSWVQELADAWASSTDPTRKQCGYGLIDELSKSKKKSAPSDDDFSGWIQAIDQDPSGACAPFDVVKHLDNERLRRKLGLSAG